MVRVGGCVCVCVCRGAGLWIIVLRVAWRREKVGKGSRGGGLALTEGPG